MIMFILGGCTKKASVEKKIEFKIYNDGEVVSHSITNDDKIKEVLDILNKCIDKKNFERERDKFDLPKSTTYEIVLNKDAEHTYKFIAGYVVYDSMVYFIDDYENVINKFEDLFAI